MAVYAIRTVKDGRTLSRRQVSEGMGRSGAVIIKAQAGAGYVFSDAIDIKGNAPAKISFKRVGKDLHLSLASQNLETPDLIIEGYFDFPPAPVSGVLGNGNVAQYDLGSVANISQAGELASNASSTAPTSASSSSSNMSSSALPGVDNGLPLWVYGAGILVGGLALSGGGGKKGGVDASQTALDKIKAYADDNNKIAPELNDYQSAGIVGVSTTNLAAINNAVDTLTGTQTDSKAKVQTVVDAYVRILAEANGTAVDGTAYNPQVSDYQAIGANIGLAASNAAALTLLNDVVGSLTSTGVDTVAEINALAAVTNKIMDIAAAGVPSSPLTLADLVLIGLPTSGSGAINVVNLPAVLAAIASSGGQAKVDTLAELLALTGGVATLMNYAADNTQALPTVVSYTAWGVTGVNSSNVDALNNAVDAKTATGVDSKTKVQAIVDAYTVILAEANASAVDATPSSNPTVAQYATVGAVIGVAASNSGALALLNDVVGNAASTAVDTIAEINALGAVVDKVYNLASVSAGAAPLTVADCLLLGLPVTGNGAVNEGNIAAINQALSGIGSFTKVDSYSELNAVVTSQAAIVNYATDPTLAAPTVSQYAVLGYTGVSASNLIATNSSLETLGAAKVDTRTELQAIIDAYSLILAEANGTVSDATPMLDPTALQYAAVGATIGAAATSPISLSLLNDSLKGLSASSIDTIAEINALASAANAVIAGAAGTGAGAASAPTLAQLSLLGVTGITADTLAVVQNAIAATADSGLQVDTLAELQTVANTAISQAAASQTVIVNYAASSSATAPALTDFTKIGVTGMSAGNLVSINSAIDAKTATDVDTAFEVQSLVSAYVKILAESNGAAADDTPTNNPSSDDYQAIGAAIGVAVGGIAGGADAHSAALSLLNNSIQGLSATAVDTVGEINALASVVDQIIHLAMLGAGTAVPASVPTMAQLALLGLDTSLADTAAEQADIWNAIIASADTGSGVSTILALQTIVNANAH